MVHRRVTDRMQNCLKCYKTLTDWWNSSGLPHRMMSPYPQLKWPLNLWIVSPYPQLKGPLELFGVGADKVRQRTEGVETGHGWGMGPKRGVCPAH